LASVAFSLRIEKSLLPIRARPVKIARKFSARPNRAPCEAVHVGQLGLCRVPLVSCLPQVILRFMQLALGDSEFVGELRWPEASEPLRDVARRRRRRTTDVVAEISIAIGRRRRSKRHHALFEFMRELPGNDFLVMSDRHAGWESTTHAANQEPRTKNQEPE